MDAFDSQIIKRATFKHAGVLAQLAGEFDDVDEPVERLGPAAPVTPGEIAAAGGLGVAAPWLGSKLTTIAGLSKAPLTLREAASWSVSPKFFGPAVLADTLTSGLGALSEPGYQSGRLNYLNAVRRAFNRKVKGVALASREARERYGLLGIPLQVLHGIWNPVSSMAYMLRSMKGEPFNKIGSIALEAQEVVTRSLKEI